MAEQVALLDVPRQATAQEAREFHATPPWVIEEFLAACRRLYDSRAVWDVGSRQYLRKLCEPDHAWLDPCAGGARGHGMPYAEALSRQGHDVTTVDIRPDSLAEHVADFLTWEPTDVFDGVASNPPFSLACQFVEKSLEVVSAEGGLVIMLQRLNWLGSQERDPWWEAHTPMWIVRHPKRIGFHGGSGTDNQEYAHFVWVSGHNPLCSRMLSAWHGRAER